MSKQQSVLEYLIESQGKSLRDLAEYLGVEQSTPYRWANGKRKPLQAFWDGILEFLGEECEYNDDYLDMLCLRDLRDNLGEVYEGSTFEYITSQFGYNEDKHPVHEYLENIIGVPVRADATQEFESIEPKEIEPVIREHVTELIEDQFKAFFGNPLTFNEFLKLVEAYGFFFEKTRQGW